MKKAKEKDPRDTQLDLFEEQKRLESEEAARQKKLAEEKKEDDDFIEPYNPREEYYTRFDRFR